MSAHSSPSTLSSDGTAVGRGATATPGDPLGGRSIRGGAADEVVQMLLRQRGRAPATGGVGISPVAAVVPRGRHGEASVSGRGTYSAV